MFMRWKNKKENQMLLKKGSYSGNTKRKERNYEDMVLTDERFVSHKRHL